MSVAIYGQHCYFFIIIEDMYTDLYKKKLLADNFYFTKTC